MGYARTTLAVSTDATGAGTATTTRLIVGRLVRFRFPDSTLLGTGGTATVTATWPTSGGTALVAYGAAGPSDINAYGHAENSDNLRVVVSGGAVSASGTIHIIYER